MSYVLAALRDSGKITVEQQAKALQLVEPVREKYTRILPLLEEIQTMLPAYSAKVDAGMRAAGASEQIR